MHDVLVGVEYLSNLMQCAVTVISQALSFASQHTHPRGNERGVRAHT